MEGFRERLNAVLAGIESAALKAGRAAADVQLVAVSKTCPPDLIAEAVEAGQLLFGESRVQEARAKIPAVPARARWHFIGHLQKNKVRQAVSLFELIHGVDSLDIARDIDRIAGEEGLFPRVLLEVNVAGEASKHGFSPDGLRRDLEALLALPRLQIEGLMTVPPTAPDPEGSRRYFAMLRALRDELPAPLPHLSMGMSGDFGVAVEEGATLVRVGSALFGPRSGKGWRPSGGPDTFVE